MKVIPPSAGQAVYHDFIVAPSTCVPAKRLHAAYVVSAKLDLAGLERAVRQVVTAHDSLRTSMEWIDGELRQVVREPDEIADPVLEEVAWDGTPESAAMLAMSVDTWWASPRPLASRVLAGHGPAGETLVLCAFNHACSDGISAELVFGQIRDCYERPDTVLGQPDVPQFAAYQAAMTRGGIAEVYDDWVQLLDRGASAVPAWMLERKLATDRVWIRTHDREFSPELVERLRAVGRRHLCTQFEALSACTGLYFRGADGRTASIGVIHSGRGGPRGFEVAGLLRSYILDVVEHGPADSLATAVDTRRDELRARTDRYAKLPCEEACVRAGRSLGWRAGQAGPWEVELNGMFETSTQPPMGGAPVRVADLPLPEEAYCENGGPTFLISFVLGATTGRVMLRYVSPPVSDGLARRVIDDLEAVLRLVHDDPSAPVDAAPALFHVAGTEDAVTQGRHLASS